VSLSHAIGYAALVAAGAVWYVRRTQRETGVTADAALRGLPGDVVALWDRVTTGAAAAVDDGLAAARAREAELARTLAAAGARSDQG
jgi:hypothetical protein